MILIISHDKDEHAREVMQVLYKKGHPFDLLDLSHFPVSSHLSILFNSNKYESTQFETSGGRMSLDQYGSVWWRRPQPFVLHPDLKGRNEASFAVNECHAAIGGMWLLPSATWINDPVKDEVAARKVYQLKKAAEVGLRIPKTCVTNNPNTASEFISSLGIGNVIYKSFSATEQAWRETRLVKEDELPKIDNVKYAPVIFQECIHADLDLRITVIGDNIFPAAIYSQETSYKVDYRMNYHEATIVKHELPASLNERLLAFMRAMGLVYGAIDMRLDHNGEYVFLEVNPAGQWLFMETPTGMPITETLANTLIGYDVKAGKHSIKSMHSVS